VTTLVDRRLIRRELVDRLRSMGLPFERRVFANRLRAHWPEKLPACCVYTLREDISVVNAAPRRYEHKLEVSIQILAARPPAAEAVEDVTRRSDGVDDDLDWMAGEVSARLDRDQTLGGLVDDVQHQRVDYAPEREGEERYASLVLTEQVTYYTEAGERPEGGFDPLRVVQIDLRLGAAP
jgi:hypothetical protein